MLASFVRVFLCQSLVLYGATSPHCNDMIVLILHTYISAIAKFHTYPFYQLSSSMYAAWI